MWSGRAMKTRKKILSRCFQVSLSLDVFRSCQGHYCWSIFQWFTNIISYMDRELIWMKKKFILRQEFLFNRCNRCAINLKTKIIDERLIRLFSLSLVVVLLSWENICCTLLSNGSTWFDVFDKKNKITAWDGEKNQQYSRIKIYDVASHVILLVDDYLLPCDSYCNESKSRWRRVMMNDYEVSLLSCSSSICEINWNFHIWKITIDKKWDKKIFSIEFT